MNEIKQRSERRETVIAFAAHVAGVLDAAGIACYRKVTTTNAEMIVATYDGITINMTICKARN
jgi:putative intracellular protease/amidase